MTIVATSAQRHVPQRCTFVGLMIHTHNAVTALPQVDEVAQIMMYMKRGSRVNYELATR